MKIFCSSCGKDLGEITEGNIRRSIRFTCAVCYARITWNKLPAGVERFERISKRREG